MNQKATYELTITEKLEQLSAPDMVDAIWARIEAQLDIDLPTDDGPANPPAAPKTGPAKWISRGFVIAAISIVLIYFFNNRKQTTTLNDTPTTTAPLTPAGNESPVRNNSPGSNNINSQKNNAGGGITTPSTTLPADSNTITPLTGPVQLQQDSSTVNSNNQPVINPQLITVPKIQPPDSTKKSRGIKGITDNDYRIVPKKDSSRGN